MCSTSRIWEEWPQPPTWIEVKKHTPISASVSWDVIVKGTKGRSSRYKRGVLRQQLEMECFRQGIANPRYLECTKRGNEDTAVFWSHCRDEIGASDGEGAEYIVVKFQLHGTITQLHGYPVTLRELRNEYGVNI